MPEYRTGSCSGTANGFKCNAQPICTTNKQYLKGSSPTKAGTCAVCSFAECGAGEYRSGTCGGTTNGFTCKDQATCGAGQYLKGASELTLGVCTKCPKFTWMDETEHRHPKCKPQVTCEAGQYLPTSRALEKGFVFGICLPCEAESDPKLPNVPRYQEQTGHRESSCKAQEGCGSAHYLSATTETKGVCEPCPAGQWMPFKPNTTICSSTGAGSVAACRAARASRLSKWDNGCTAFAKGFVQDNHTCHSCGATERHYGSCDLGECRALCADLYDGTSPDVAANPGNASGDLAECLRGCAKMNEMLGMPGVHHHTSCHPHQACAPNQYETAVATNTSDRVCTVDDGCTAEQYEVQPLTATSPAQCEGLSACGAGERVVVESTTTADLVCGPCPLHTFQNNSAHREATCEDVGMCGLGEFLAMTHAGANSVCTACPTSTYMDVSQHHIGRCRPHAVCGKGEHLLAATATTAGVCIPCGFGTHQDAGNHSLGACKPHTTCGAGQLHRGASPTSGGTCEPCPTDTYRPDANHTEAACIDQAYCTANQRYILPLVGGTTPTTPVRTTRARCEACATGKVQVQAKHRLATCRLPREGLTRTIVLFVLPCVEASQLSEAAVAPVLIQHSNGTLTLDDIDGIVFTSGVRGQGSETCEQPATAAVTLALDDSAGLVSRAVASMNTAIGAGKVSIPVDVKGRQVLMPLDVKVAVKFGPGPVPGPAEKNETGGSSEHSAAHDDDDDGVDMTPIVVILVLVCLGAGLAVAVWRHNKRSQGASLGTSLAFMNPAYETDSNYAPVHDPKDGDLYNDMPSLPDLFGEEGGRGNVVANSTYVEGPDQVGGEADVGATVRPADGLGAPAPSDAHYDVDFDDGAAAKDQAAVGATAVATDGIDVYSAMGAAGDQALADAPAPSDAHYDVDFDDGAAAEDQGGSYDHDHPNADKHTAATEHDGVDHPDKRSGRPLPDVADDFDGVGGGWAGHSESPGAGVANHTLPTAAHTTCSYTGGTRDCSTKIDLGVTYCSNHACPTEGCSNSKSSRADFCSTCPAGGGGAADDHEYLKVAGQNNMDL